MSNADILATLLLPFDKGHLDPPAPGRGLFLRAEPGPGLDAAWRERLTCEQTFKPTHDALLRQGFRVGDDVEADGASFDVALVRLTRDRRECFGLIERAWRRLAEGGVLVATGSKDEGAQTVEREVGALTPLGGHLPKHGCRVFWLVKGTMGAQFERALGDWRAAATPRALVEGRFVSRPGLFSWDRVDEGSRLLLAHLPEEVSGVVADLGAGWGLLSAALAERAAVRALDLYEAERLALDCARANTPAREGLELSFRWHDVTSGLPKIRYHWIVTNPPFHAGGTADPELGRRFIAAAADALRPKGRLVMVANRHLPYERILKERFAGTTTLVEDARYKVLLAGK
jgi:16S rRNA (guanine1207-N2)-methyltransferase